MSNEERERLSAMARADQAAEWLRNSLPPLLWGLYSNCLKEGFTESQAMTLLLKYMEKISE